MNSDLLDHLKNVFDVSAKFFYDLICIESETTNSLPGIGVTLDGITFTSAANNDFDMEIFVVSDNKPEESYVAFAGGIGANSISGRPLYGKVNINEAHY